MKRYNIIYHETYSDTYEVEAETLGFADEEILLMVKEADLGFE